MYYIEILLILACIPLGVMGGGALNAKLPARILLSLIFAYVTLGLSWWALGYAVLFYLGQSFGHGHPVGWIIRGKEDGFEERESWEPKGIKPYPSLALRGLLHMHPAMIVSLPLAMFISGYIPSLPWIDNRWRCWESLKFSLALLITVIFNHLYPI